MIRSVILSFLMVGFMASCSSTNTSSTSGAANNGSGSNNSYLVLADYLRVVSGVQVRQQGNNYVVLVRGMTSEHGMGEPLYVIDRMRVVGYESAAALADPNDISRVEVLKDTASTLSYGLQGANGVIVIHLKK